MSKYTTEVRYICEKAAGYDESKGYADVDSIISESIPKIFNFAFPIFDDSYKDVICTKILRHYYTREIGFETVGLWKLKLETLLNEIMPYYNQLYKSELLKFNPLYDTDMNTTHVGDKNSEQTTEENKSGFSNTNSERSESGSIDKSGNTIEGENKSGTSSNDESSTTVTNEKGNKSGSNSESGGDTRNKVNANNYADSESSTNYDLYSDTPQGALNGVDDEEYLTNARKITDSKTKSGKRDDTEIDKGDYNKSGSTSEDIKNESVGTGSLNSRNRYDEDNNRTVINNDKTVDSRTGNTNSNTNDFENRSGSEKINSTESYVVHVVGKQGGVSYSKLLKEFRDTFLNIDLEVINALNVLFMNIW